MLEDSAVRLEAMSQNPLAELPLVGHALFGILLVAQLLISRL